MLPCGRVGLLMEVEAAIGARSSGGGDGSSGAVGGKEAKAKWGISPGRIRG